MIYLEDPTLISASFLRAIQEEPEEPKVIFHEDTALKARIAWRIVREAVLLNRWLNYDEALASLVPEEDLSLDLDPETYWTLPSPRTRSITLHTEEDLQQEMAQALPELRGLQPAYEPHAQRALRGLSLLPPQDHALHAHWLQAQSLVGARLRVTKAIGKEDPDTGRISYDSDGPARAARALFTRTETWPSREEILQTENDIAEHVCRLLVERGMARTRSFLVVAYGLTERECRMVEALARQRARGLTDGEVEDKRSLLELRFEDIAYRAQEAKELRTELMAVKSLAVVQGVAKAEVEDDGAIFAKVAKRTITVSSNAPRQLAAPED